MPDARLPTLVLPRATAIHLPTIITAAGERASRRFVEFFTANIRNPNTRAALRRRPSAGSPPGATRTGWPWADLEPVAVSAYVEQLMLTPVGSNREAGTWRRSAC